MRNYSESWRAKAKAKVINMESRIPEQWILRQQDLEEARTQRKLTGPFTEKFLNDNEVAIIQNDSVQLVQKIKSHQYTAVEVAQAFCHMAAIAQQVVCPCFLTFHEASSNRSIGGCANINIPLQNNCLHEIMFDAALDTAKELDEFYSDKGVVKGPLHGLPISLKDQFHVKGYDTSMGYVGWIESYEGEKDPAKVHKINSQIVRELLSLGAVLYCKVIVSSPQFSQMLSVLV